MAGKRARKTAPEAHDTRHAVSKLLMAQIERLQQVVREQIHTERQAAQYIKELTKRVWARNPQTLPKLNKPKTSARRSTKKPGHRSTGPRKARR